MSQIANERHQRFGLHTVSVIRVRLIRFILPVVNAHFDAGVVGVFGCVCPFAVPVQFSSFLGSVKVPSATRRYIQDIEVQTGRAVKKEQIDNLKLDLRNNDYSVKLSRIDARAHRSIFNTKKDELIKQWEINTGQQ